MAKKIGHINCNTKRRREGKTKIVSFSVSVPIANAFAAKCPEGQRSKVIEKFMSQFIDTHKYWELEEIDLENQLRVVRDLKQRALIKMRKKAAEERDEL